MSRPRLATLVHLAALAAALLPLAVACGARSSLPTPSPDGGAGGAEGCTRSGSAPMSAAIGGPIDDQLTECFDPPDSGQCPALEDAKPFFEKLSCGGSIVSVDCGPIPGEARCCYRVTEICGYS